MPELVALFLPLAAWMLASRREAWNELLAATAVTTAVAAPVLVLAATLEVFLWPELLRLASPLGWASARPAGPLAPAQRNGARLYGTGHYTPCIVGGRRRHALNPGDDMAANIIEGSPTRSFQAEVIESETLVLVDFWVSWCGPCRVVAPVLEEIAHERDDVRIVKLNVDENQVTAACSGAFDPDP